MPNRKRPVTIIFRTTPEERAMIDKRMEQAGINNMAAYLRKMAIDGYVIKLDLPELRELVTQLRRYNNNLNQIAKRVNATNRFYDADLAELRQSQEKMWDSVNEILMKLSSV